MKNPCDECLVQAACRDKWCEIWFNYTDHLTAMKFQELDKKQRENFEKMKARGVCDEKPVRKMFG